MLKKSLIIYAVLFAVTVAIPAIVCFGNFSEGGESDELVNIFRQCISLFEYYC